MFHVWVQYHLRRQLDTAAAHAHARGVALKGDLPIGVSPTSVETWVHPEWFHLGTQSGAPPDDFALDGQNWGFPTYDWDAMAEDGYGWWRHRFEALARTFDRTASTTCSASSASGRSPPGPARGCSVGSGRACRCRRPRFAAGSTTSTSTRSPDRPATTHATSRCSTSTVAGTRGSAGGRRPPTSASRPARRAAFDAMANDFFHRPARPPVAWARPDGAAGRGRRDPAAGLRRGPRHGAAIGSRGDARARGPVAADRAHAHARGHLAQRPGRRPYLAVTSTGTHDMPVLRLLVAGRPPTRRRGCGPRRWNGPAPRRSSSRRRWRRSSSPPSWRPRRCCASCRSRTCSPSTATCGTTTPTPNRSTSRRTGTTAGATGCTCAPPTCTTRTAFTARVRSLVAGAGRATGPPTRLTPTTGGHHVDMQLDGRTALVTGGSSGIGASVAAHLADEGCRVLVHGRTAASAGAQVDRIRAAGGAGRGRLGRPRRRGGRSMPCSPPSTSTGRSTCWSPTPARSASTPSTRRPTTTSAGPSRATSCRWSAASATSCRACVPAGGDGSSPSAPAGRSRRWPT